MTDSIIPPISSVSQAERMFRVNWVANLKKTPSGVPFVTADFVAKQGRRVRVIDVRDADELVGVLGYLPGSDWVPLERIDSLVDRIGSDDPIILVSGGEERAHDAAALLSKRGLRFVAFMVGGLYSWRDLGYSTTRDPSILDRCDELRAIGDVEALESVTEEDVKKHVGDRLAVKWIKLPAILVRGLVSCVDGRDDSGIVGSPGGDVGELLVGLRSLERLTRRDLSAEQVATLLARRLDAFGRFYMHTDVVAVNEGIKVLREDRRFDEALRDVKDALDWRRFFTAPPKELRATLLDLAIQPSQIGCGHLRLAAEKPEEYETRPPLVHAVLRAFHEKRWEGAPEMEYVPLGGGHDERAVLNIRVGGPLLPFSRIPLVSPAVAARRSSSIIRA